MDIDRLRADFPLLARKVHGKPLVYLDNAATTQKPLPVIETLDRYYRMHNANIHRGIHAVAEEATEAFETARKRVAAFINSPSERSVIFTSGTTESINLVARSWGGANLKPGDEVLISHMEHHSNIVPWQLICAQTGASLRVIPIDDHGQLVLDSLDDLLTERTRLLAITQMSNALGTINPVSSLIKRAHAAGAKVLIDAAQSVPHLGVDVQDLDCDFLAFSGHKVFGPTGIGVLYGREALLESMPPFLGGGEMIKQVRLDGSEFNDPPYRFEAGTPNIAGAIGLGAAIDYVQSLGPERIAQREAALLAWGTEALGSVPGLRLIGTAAQKAAVLSFVLDFAHPLDAGMILDRQGIAVRTGHHCAQPVMDRFKIPATVRASLAVYNTEREIDSLVQGLEKVRDLS
ncbi:MAG: cysteine desulfurase [Phycisphaeraceae bacterium]|nr:cysteine desulfurase [Phycisphaeraceae bacterium]